MKMKSPAKVQVIDFVTKTGMEEDYSFTYAGDVRKSEEFVHRMRVELSRLRGMLKRRGRKISIFKMLLVSITQVSEKPPRCKIILKKSGSAQVELDENMADALDAIERGAR